jgi:Transcriptional regulators
VLILPEESSEELRALAESGYPLVVVDPLERPDEVVSTVSATNALGGRTATEHLLSLGHRRIGVITGVPDWLSSVGRLSGYRAALASAGCPFRSGARCRVRLGSRRRRDCCCVLLDRP